MSPGVRGAIQSSGNPTQGRRPGSKLLPGFSGATRLGATAATTRSLRYRPGAHSMTLGYRETVYKEGEMGPLGTMLNKK